MSDYTKATNFAAKDGLPVGEPDKKVKGVEIDNEFNAIANAISTKADTNSPSLSGTPTAPTAAAGTSTTQLATTAFVQTEITANATTAGTGLTDTSGTFSIATNSNGYGTRTVSTSNPSGGSDGDIWYKVSS